MNFTHNTVTVTTAGVRVRVTASKTPVKWVRFKAVAVNAGAVYVGDSAVASTTGWTMYDADLATGEGLILNPGAYGGTLNLADFYVDSAQNGDKVEYFAIVSRGG